MGNRGRVEKERTREKEREMEAEITIYLGNRAGRKDRIREIETNGDKNKNERTNEDRMLTLERKRDNIIQIDKKTDGQIKQSVTNKGKEIQKRTRLRTCGCGGMGTKWTTSSFSDNNRV